MRLFGKKPKAAKARFSLPMWIKARFDAAQTTKDNARHWAAAEFLSADAEADPAVRKILRTRARYEVQNNSYARGIVSTLANDSVGTGPRLQMLLDSEDTNRRVEHDFAVWARLVHLPAKLRTMRMARCQDGESFAIMAQNPNLGSNVTLDIQLIEADRVTDDELNADEASVDGITFDRFGNPKSYKVLKNHPGGTASFNLDFKTVGAENMIHVFRQDRPEQHRGIPEITSALPLFAHLRRFTLAVVSAAEAAADFAGVLYTDSPPNGEADAVEAMDTIQLERNMLLTMPGGWKMSQVDPKQPVTTYGEFKHEILNEISRCLNIPYNIAAGNSSGYNYASGRLDHQTYYRPRVHGGGRPRQNPRAVAPRVGAGEQDGARRVRLPPHMVLGRPRTRRSLEGGDGAGEAPQEPHHDACQRIRETGQGLGIRTPPVREGEGAYGRTRADGRGGRALRTGKGRR